MMASTKTLAIRGVLFNWIARVCAFCIAFVRTPILLTCLGDELYGAWGIVMSVGAYYALADFGMQAGCVKYISQFHARNETERIQKLFATAFFTYTVLALVLVIVSIPVSWLFPSVFNVTSEASSARWAVFLVGISVAIRLQAQVFQATIKAYKRFDIANTISVFQQLIQAGLVIWLVTHGFGLISMGFAVLGVTVAGRFIEAIAAYRLLGNIPLSRSYIDREAFQLLFRFGGLNVIRLTAGRVQSVSPPIIIGVILGSTAVPLFTIADSLLQTSRSLIKGINGVILPVASQLHAQNRREEIIQMMVIVSRISMCIALCFSVCVLYIGEQFLTIWIGAELSSEIHTVLCVMAVGLIGGMVSAGNREILSGVGKIGFVAKTNVLIAIVSIIAGALLCKSHGVIGLTWGMVVPVVLGNAIFPFVICREFDQHFGRFLVSILVRPLIAIVPVVAAAQFLTVLIDTSTLINWLAVAIAVCFVFGVSSYVFCIDRELRSDILRSLYRKRKLAKAV